MNAILVFINLKEKDMFIIIPILLLTLGITLTILACNDVFYSEIVETICIILAVIFLITGAFFGVNAGVYIAIKSNADVYHIEKMELREAYVALLSKYEDLSKQDLTASKAYLDLYDRIIDFNTDVRLAQNNKNRAFWMEGLFYSSVYLNLEPIPIN